MSVALAVAAALEADGVGVALESGWLHVALETATGFDEATVTVLGGATSAALGAFVAWTAYRGYVRNDSRPMLFLALGVVLLTTVPFVVSHAIDRLTPATDATVLLAITVCHLLGLLAVVLSFRRPDRS